MSEKFPTKDNDLSNLKNQIEKANEIKVNSLEDKSTLDQVEAKKVVTEIGLEKDQAEKVAESAREAKKRKDAIDSVNLALNQLKAIEDQARKDGYTEDYLSGHTDTELKILLADLEREGDDRNYITVEKVLASKNKKFSAEKSTLNSDAFGKTTQDKEFFGKDFDKKINDDAEKAKNELNKKIDDKAARLSKPEDSEEVKKWKQERGANGIPTYSDAEGNPLSKEEFDAMNNSTKAPDMNIVKGMEAKMAENVDGQNPKTKEDYKKIAQGEKVDPNEKLRNALKDKLAAKDKKETKKLDDFHPDAAKIDINSPENKKAIIEDVKLKTLSNSYKSAQEEFWKVKNRDFKTDSDVFKAEQIVKDAKKAYEAERNIQGKKSVEEILAKRISGHKKQIEEARKKMGKTGLLKKLTPEQKQIQLEILQKERQIENLENRTNNIEKKNFEYSIRHKSLFGRTLERIKRKGGKFNKEYIQTKANRKKIGKRMLNSALIGAGVAGTIGLVAGTGGVGAIAIAGGISGVRGLGGFLGAETAASLFKRNQKDYRLDMKKLRENMDSPEYAAKRNSLLNNVGANIKKNNRWKKGAMILGGMIGGLSAASVNESIATGELTADPFAKFGKGLWNIANGETISNIWDRFNSIPDASGASNFELTGAGNSDAVIDNNYGPQDLSQEDITTAPKVETSGDIFIRKGEGITDAYLRQLESSEELRKYFGITGKPTGADAFRAAQELGYIDANSEVRVNFGKGAGYEMKVIDGKLMSFEHFGGHIDDAGNYVNNAPANEVKVANNLSGIEQNIEDSSTSENYEYRTGRGELEINSLEDEVHDNAVYQTNTISDSLNTAGISDLNLTNLDTIPDRITDTVVQNPGINLDTIPDTLDSEVVETYTGPTQAEIDLENQKIAMEQQRIALERQRMLMQQQQIEIQKRIDLNKSKVKVKTSGGFWRFLGRFTEKVGAVVVGNEITRGLHGGGSNTVINNTIYKTPPIIPDPTPRDIGYNDGSKN